MSDWRGESLDAIWLFEMLWERQLPLSLMFRGSGALAMNAPGVPPENRLVRTIFDCASVGEVELTVGTSKGVGAGAIRRLIGMAVHEASLVPSAGTVGIRMTGQGGTVWERCLRPRWPEYWEVTDQGSHAELTSVSEAHALERARSAVGRRVAVEVRRVSPWRPLYWRAPFPVAFVARWQKPSPDGWVCLRENDGWRDRAAFWSAFIARAGGQNS